MDAQPHIVFAKADMLFLRGLANELHITLHASWEIKQAQEMYEKGVKIPGTENGSEPIESEYMLQILDVVEKADKLPEGFASKLAVYLNDRGFAKLPEDVRTLVWREARYARNQLMEATSALLKERQRV